jgi:hypothetical protein
MNKKITIYIDTLPINELYDSGMTTYEIAEKFQISQYAVWRRVKDPRKDVARDGKHGFLGKFGKDCPCYKNGTGIYRRLVQREKCFECGSSKNIMVHHIDQDRKNNNPNNLIPLCKSCHCKEHDIIKNIKWMCDK